MIGAITEMWTRCLCLLHTPPTTLRLTPRGIRGTDPTGFNILSVGSKLPRILQIDAVALGNPNLFAAEFRAHDRVNKTLGAKLVVALELIAL